MGGIRRRWLAVAVLVVIAISPLELGLGPASAYPSLPPGHWGIYFDYDVNATTHTKKLDQTITVPTGRFQGVIDLTNPYGPDGAQVTGDMYLPPAQFTFRIAGIVPLVTATAQITQTKPVTGGLNLTGFIMTATATVNIRIVDAHAEGTTTNLVGNSCMTETPVTVTMSGPAKLGKASTFSGEYVLPNFKDCELATTALNLVLPGPGNTFTAVATPHV